jgi:hypothetical protein
MAIKATHFLGGGRDRGPNCLPIVLVSLWRKDAAEKSLQTGRRGQEFRSKAAVQKA